MITADNPARWRAVLRRDARFDGTFVYAVRSTGVYCRPSCASRRPRRRQVVFYPLPEVAERAGFRACKRCHPRRARARNSQAMLVRRVCRVLEQNSDAPLTLTALSRRISLSPYHLARTFKQLMGLTPRQYAETLRLEQFKTHVRGGRNVTTALYAAGYGSSSRLYERAPSRLGMTPATYRRGGRGMEICYTLVASPLGRLLVAATGRGICAVSLGNNDKKLTAWLRSEFPQASLRRDPNGLRAWVRAVVEKTRGREPRAELPLDIRATAFQWRVWEELRKIPPGSTRSYGEIAKRIGQPTAARAVARACATNPAAVVVPCHRVVRGDGHPGGYRWGVETKLALLENEKKD